MKQYDTSPGLILFHKYRAENRAKQRARMSEPAPLAEKVSDKIRFQETLDAGVEKMREATTGQDLPVVPAPGYAQVQLAK